MESKIKLIIPLLLIVIAVSLPITTISTKSLIKIQIQFETIEEAWGSENPSYEYLIIDNQGLWKITWDRIFSQNQPENPFIDFRINFVIAVFFGMKGTSGYIINITKVIEKLSYFYVFVEEISPSPESLTLQVITYPCHIIIIPRLFKDIIFVKSRIIKV
ncbi:MAG: protease complex subunit PrcB family protein [Candidatus Thorarchaeota archaeon]